MNQSRTNHAGTEIPIAQGAVSNIALKTSTDPKMTDRLTSQGTITAKP